MRSLRVRLAVTGFLTAYAPTLLLLIIAIMFSRSEDFTVQEEVVGGEFAETETIITSGLPLSVVAIVAVGFAPFAALFAWWWSGRAVRPLAEAIALQERLMEETSHELRTPLAVLSNNAQVLLAHPNPTIEVYRQGLERSETVAQRMSETIDSLLVDARGRARTVDRVPTDLVELTGSVVEALGPLATKRGIALVLDAPEAVDAAVDQSSVGRAISNLITNAIQHGPIDSTVHIEVTRDGSLARVAVTDSGPGIPPEQQDEIFERYWQSDASEGSGIGLAIVKQVAEAHGGTVSVTSPLGERPGARFTLTVAA